MNDIQIFEHTDFGAIRTLTIQGEPWFVVADVCKALEIGNPTRAVQRLDEDEQALISIQGASNGLPVNAVNEPGLYSLVLGSRKPEAKAFKRWITHEVIPSIRKHGAYMTQETLEAMIADPSTTIRILSELQAEREQRRALEAKNSALTVQNQIMAPKADYFDQLVDRNLLTNFRGTAKEFGVSPKKFVQFLLEKKFLYRDKAGKLLPYEAKNDGLFEVKECYNEKTQWKGTQTLITPKGRETFRLLYIE